MVCHPFSVAKSENHVAYLVHRRRSYCHEVEHTLVIVWAFAPPLLSDLEEIFQLFFSVNQSARVYGTALLVQPKHELGAYTEVTTATPDRPE